MLGNPAFFEIDRQRAMGMWPTPTMISRGVIPYIKRMKKDKVRVTVVGDLRGDTVFDLLENCPNIFRLYVVNDYSKDENSETHQKLFETNTVRYKDKIKFKNDRDSDVVCIDERFCDPETLARYYKLTNSGGIFCGNGHDREDVKTVLTTFRRAEKIGTPIQVSHKYVWFWNKR